jgi:hypothetical protein
LSEILDVQMATLAAAPATDGEYREEEGDGKGHQTVKRELTHFFELKTQTFTYYIGWFPSIFIDKKPRQTKKNKRLF